MVLTALVLSLCAAGPAPAAAAEKGLRLDWGQQAALLVDGKKLPLGGTVDALLAVLGAPTWQQVNPPDNTAMSDTTYLFYSERGLSVRTKQGVVEGFYVQLKAMDLDGHKESAATLVLPRGLTTKAPVSKVVAALGEPTRRKAFDLELSDVHALDLIYERGSTVTLFRFDHSTFVAINLELAPTPNK
jgi:hypothetical protein